MKIKLVRGKGNAKSVEGKMYIDGVFECYTLEDADRRLEAGGTKVQNKTAIPRGIYEVKWTHSNRFNKDMPILLDVPQFTGVRIHAGNAANKVIATTTVVKDKSKPTLASPEFIEVY